MAGLTRRNFMLGSAVAAAGVLMAGCSASGNGSGSDAGSAVAWDEETDIVVVGTGTAGIVSAVTAIEAGAKVTLVEKADFAGGISSACVQFCTPGSSLGLPQLFDDVEDSAELLYEDMMKASENTADPKYLKILCDGAQPAADWLIEHGCEFKPALKMAEGRPGRGKYIYASTGEPGVKMLPVLEGQADIKLKTTLEEIIYDEAEGRVTGVAVLNEKGERSTIKAAKGVILCTGMWHDDDVMMARHAPVAPAIVNEAAAVFEGMGMPYGPMTGEAIRAAQKIGAAVRHMDYVVPEPWYAPAELMSQGIGVAGATRSVNQVMVGADGKRFTNEGAGRGHCGQDTIDKADGLFFPVYDGHIMPSQANPPQEKLDAWVADGHVAKGETLEELAANMESLFGVPQEAFLETMTAYNGYCAAGEDLEFGKDPHYLAPFDQPPFYAGPKQTALQFYTHGGLDADENGAVRNIDGEVIPGLFAAGMCAGGHLGRDTVSGAWQTNSVVFGRLAGAAAAAN